MRCIAHPSTPVSSADDIIVFSVLVAKVESMHTTRPFCTFSVIIEKRRRNPGLVDPLVRDRIQERQIRHFYKADPDLWTRRG
jgi:hypothetical protein